MAACDAVIGVIGLGQIGGGIAVNLARDGCTVVGYDPKDAAQARLREAGGEPLDSAEQLVLRAQVILVALPGDVAVQTTRELLIPLCRAGQIVVDHSTVPAPQTRSLGAALTGRGVHYLDVPVSGGAGGAARGELRMFAGGDRADFNACLPLFNVAGDPRKIHHYGPIGMGQVAKVVQQLTRRLPDMARLEVMAFGLRAGLTKDQLMAALDVDPESSGDYARLFRAVERDDKRQLALLASEWAYYLEEAAAINMRMPMLQAALDLVRDAEKTAMDVVGRPMPCLWDELMRAKAETCDPGG